MTAPRIPRPDDPLSPREAGCGLVLALVLVVVGVLPWGLGVCQIARWLGLIGG